MIEIPIDVLQHYNMDSLEAYKVDFGDSIETEFLFYKTFLIETDHVPLKILENQILGNDTKNIKYYTDILDYREFCRIKVNELQNMLDAIRSQMTCEEIGKMEE